MISDMVERLLTTGPLGQLLGEKRQLVLRATIIGGLILAILGIAVVASVRQMQLLLVLCAGVGAVLAFLYRPPLGLAALIIGGMAVPFGLSTGTQSSLNPAVLILMLLGGLWLFDRLARKQRLLAFTSRTYLPLLAFSIVVILSFGLGQIPWFIYARAAPLRSQLVGLLIFLLSFLAFVLVSQQVKAERWLKVMVWVVILLGGFYVAGRLFQPLRMVINRLFQHNGGGSLFWVWLVCLSFSQALFNRQLHLRWRLLAGGIALAALFVGLVVVREWTSGWLPAIVGLVVILWFGAPRLGLAATIVGGLVMAVKITDVTRIVMVGDNQYSLMTRLEAWKIVLEIVKVNPILGLGPSNYYFYTPLYPILGYAVQFNSHNNYVDIIAQTGFLGLACFFWFVIETGWLGFKLSLKVPEGFPRSYVFGCMGGLAGTVVAAMLGDWAIPFVYNVGMNGFRVSMLAWLFLGGLVCMEQFYLTNRKAPSGSE
jgi:hypothetical protein